MSRRRTPRTQDHVLVQFVEALDRLTAALTESRRSPETPLVMPELMLCRHLGGKHLGCLIELVPRPVEKFQHEHPEIMLLAGELVGIRPGSPGRGSQPPDMTLVIRQGGEQSIKVVRVDAPVKVFPRSVR